jgi:formate C-acetyltransferase
MEGWPVCRSRKAFRGPGFGPPGAYGRAQVRVQDGPSRTGGTLLNQKFTPELLDGDEGIDNLASLVRTYFKLDGHHVQFNVVRAETLRDAQAHPDQYRDLIVRVAVTATISWT